VISYRALLRLDAVRNLLLAAALVRLAERMLGLAEDATSNFLMVLPHKVQADPSISTE